MDREPHAPAAARGGGDLCSRYDILGRLAVGGMAELFLARPKGSAQVVVVKRILPQLAEDPEFVRMFRDEAHLASTLQHPNVARVFDFGLDGEEPFFAMEYVHGENLRTILRGAIAKCEPIPLALVLTIADGLTAALHHAHEQTDGDGRPLLIVHRDVSPTNVLVSQSGEVKIVDFGIAKAAAGTHVTQAGMLKGKASYMSPEQCRAEGVDRRSDIFAIGILLYELTTLQRLFKGDNELAILHQILTGRITHPSTVTNNYPPELEAILLRTLQIDPNLRYPTAAALRGDLRTFAHRHGLTISSEALARYLVERFGEKPYPGGEPPPPPAREEAPTLLREDSAAPANARPASRTPTGTNAAAKPGGAGLKPAPRPKAATPGLVARKSGPTGAVSARGPISARPTETPSARSASAPAIVGVPGSTTATTATSRPPTPTTRPASTSSPAPRSSNTAPASPQRSSNTAPASTQRSSSTAPASPQRSSSTAPASPQRSSNTAPASPQRSSNTAPASPQRASNTAPASPQRSSNTAPASPHRSPSTAPAGPQWSPSAASTSPRPATPLPPSARPTTVPTAPRPSVPSNGTPGPSAESAAFLRGEMPVGAEFSAGTDDGRPGGTQIATPVGSQLAPPLVPPLAPPLAPTAVAGIVTLPGPPSGVDRTTIAMTDEPAPSDRTMIAPSAPDAPAPTHAGTDATVPMDVGPRGPRRDATVMLPAHAGGPRAPGGVDRTVIVSADDASPVRATAAARESSWPTPARSGETQPVPIEPGGSSLGRAVAQPPAASAGLLFAVVLGVVVVVGAMAAGVWLAWPHLRAAADGGEQTPVLVDASADGEAGEAPVDPTTPPDEPTTPEPTTPEPTTPEPTTPEPTTPEPTTPEPTPPEPTPPEPTTPEPTPPEPTPPEPKPPEPKPPEPTTPDPKPPEPKTTPDEPTPPEPKTTPDEPKPKTPKKPKPKKPKPKPDPHVPDFKPGPFVPP